MTKLTKFDFNEVHAKMKPIIWNLVCLLMMNSVERQYYWKNPVSLDSEYISIFQMKNYKLVMFVL